MIDEGYRAYSRPPHMFIDTLKKEIHKQGWEINTKGKLGSLYLIGKAKSLKKKQWLWRGINAIPVPFLTKRQLRVGARSMTRFLRYLGDGIPCNILLHSVRDVSRGYASLDEIGVTHISEIDCKDQFNKISPTTVLSHMDAASAWLTKRRRWRAKETVWSIHKDHKQLDRAGQGASGKFWYMTHEDFCAVLKFEMSKNTYVQANGKVWGRGHCIPMGGSFSAQSADLHSCWGLYQARRFLRSLGSLHFNSAGFSYWVNQQGCVSQCQCEITC